jgi:hypothetical protein
MNQRPFFSIITPTYNHEQFIGKCIASVANQTFGEWEQIVVDDGSTDRTWEIENQYAAQDNRIKLIRREHLGPEKLAELYNLGLSQAQADWIAILEGDDYWYPNKLELQVSGCKLGAIFSYGAYIDEINGGLQPGLQPPFSGQISTKRFTPYVLLYKSFMIAVTQVINKKALLSIKGFQQDISPAAVDMATMLKLIRLPGDIIYIPQPLGIWRHHSTQSTNLLAVELAKSNSSMAVQFFNSLTESDKLELGITREEILRVRRAQIADAYFGVLRNRLKNAETGNIQELIKGTWKFGGIKRKCQAAYGLIANYFGLNFETLLRGAERFAAIWEKNKNDE